MVQVGGDSECLPAAGTGTNSDMPAAADYVSLLFSWTPLSHVLPTGWRLQCTEVP